MLPTLCYTLLIMQFKIGTVQKFINIRKNNCHFYPRTEKSVHLLKKKRIKWTQINRKREREKLKKMQKQVSR